MNIEQLRALLAKRLEDGKAITAKAKNEGRATLTPEEDESLSVILAEVKSLRTQIELAEVEATETAEAEAAAARTQAEAAAARAAAGKSPAGSVHVTSEPPLFRNFGEQLQAIVQSSRPGATVDERLLKVGQLPEFQAAVSGGAASVDSDGGYLIVPTFTEAIMKRANDVGVLAKRCSEVTVGANSDRAEIPYIDETSRVTGSRWGGVQIYRAAEADTVTAKKPKIGKWEVKVEKLMGLAYMTDELLADAPLMASVYEQAFGEEFAFVLDDEIVRGTGSGQCLGILNAACTVSVAKETGQAATTFVYENAIKMRARLWARSRQAAAWFINQDVEPQLFSMSLAVGTGGLPVYLPANGAAGQPYDTLLGMPIIPIEHCATLGTVGDVILAAMPEYALARKGAFESASSMHVRFINGEQTFRFTQRVNGQPKWASALTPYKGSNTLSPFVTLATRS